MNKTEAIEYLQKRKKIKQKVNPKFNLKEEKLIKLTMKEGEDLDD